MSALYGSLKGSRGEATRCGTKNSGIRSSVQSWNGSLVSYMDLNDEGQPIVELYISDSSTGSSWGAEKVFSGTLTQLKNLLESAGK